jgi:hypothetical protein
MHLRERPRTDEIDHSFQHHDCQPYWLRTGDKWTNIDYKDKASTWMKPLERGEETGMVQIPANWDVSHTLFVVFSSIICAELIQSWTTCPL